MWQEPCGEAGGLVTMANQPTASLFTVPSLPRGVGCIFYEMATGRPLFPGSTVEEQLHFIFRILGEEERALGTVGTFRDALWMLRVILLPCQEPQLRRRGQAFCPTKNLRHTTTPSIEPRPF